MFTCCERKTFAKLREEELKNNKSELPNTGTEDNKLLTSLGFLGLILGTSPLLKRKYK